MTEKPQQTINITKGKRGWSVETIVNWPGVNHPATGYSSEPTLAIARHWDYEPISNTPINTNAPTRPGNAPVHTQDQLPYT